jgi:hypothetical protein
MFGEWTYNRDARSGVEKGEKIERSNFVVVESPIALDRILAVQYFRRNLALRDWSSFLDVYGIPSMFFIGKRLNFDRLDGGGIRRYVKPASAPRATWPG